MDFQARCIQFLGETTGTSRAGNPWRKKEWVVETYGQFPRKVKVQCFGDRSAALNLEPGKDYTLYVDLESREYNGRWYTDVSVYRVDESTAPGNSVPGQMPQSGGYGQPMNPGVNMPYGQPAGDPGFGPAPSFASESPEEDLPF